MNQSQEMRWLIPVLNGRTNWYEERKSKLSLDGFNLHLLEDSGACVLQESELCWNFCRSPERVCLCWSWIQCQMTKSNGFSLSSKRREGLGCPGRDTHLFLDGAPALQGADAPSLRTSDLPTLKMQSLLNINHYWNPPVICFHLFGFPWNWNRFLSQLRWKPAN